MKSEPEKLHLIRGGMSHNAFGGHERLDKCYLRGPSLLGGLLVDVVSDVPGERILRVSSISDAVHNYLLFGLGTC